MFAGNVCCQYPYVTAFFCTGPFGQYSHISSISAGIQFSAEKIGIHHIVTQAEKFHTPPPISIS